MKKLLLSFMLLSSGAANAAAINVMDGDHSVIKGWGANDSSISSIQDSQFVGLETLGYTSTLLANSTAGWATALSENKTIVVEQRAGSSANITDVIDWITNGGHLIQLGGSSGTGHVLDQIFGTSFSTGSGQSGMTATASATGTRYASFTGTLDSESSTHAFETSALLASWGGASIVANATHTGVWEASYGSGTVTYLAWDYCCSSAGTSLDDWSQVLDIAVGGAAPVSAPATISLFGLAAAGAVLRRRKRS